MPKKTTYHISFYTHPKEGEAGTPRFSERFTFKNMNFLRHTLGLLIMDGSCCRKKTADIRTEIRISANGRSWKNIESLYTRELTVHRQIVRITHRETTEDSSNELRKKYIKEAISCFKELQLIDIPLLVLVANYYNYIEYGDVYTRAELSI